MSNTWTPFAAWLCSWGGHTAVTSLLWDRAGVRSWWPILCRWSEHQQGLRDSVADTYPRQVFWPPETPPSPPLLAPSFALMVSSCVDDLLPEPRNCLLDSRCVRAGEHVPGSPDGGGREAVSYNPDPSRISHPV